MLAKTLGGQNKNNILFFFFIIIIVHFDTWKPTKFYCALFYFALCLLLLLSLLLCRCCLLKDQSTQNRYFSFWYILYWRVNTPKTFFFYLSGILFESNLCLSSWGMPHLLAIVRGSLFDSFIVYKLLSWRMQQ